MTLTVLFAITCIFVGMAISVYAFGTGGKRKHIFKDIYYSIEDVGGYAVLYTKTGEYSAIFKFTNPVQKYCADVSAYYEFNRILTSIMQTLGEGYAMHKQDVYVRRKFQKENTEGLDYLSKSYFEHFKDRKYTDAHTYLTITQENKKSKLFSYDDKKWKEFLVKVEKAASLLKDSGVSASLLTVEEATEYVDRFFAMDFDSKVPKFNNFNVTDECIEIGTRKFRTYTVVDVGDVGLPNTLRPYTNIEINNISMPVDIMGFLDSVPEADTVIYNEVTFMPSQRKELAKLEKKKHYHASFPSAGNQIAVEDITKVMDVIARESKQLVYTHYNIMIACDESVDFHRPTNAIENCLDRLGIHISQRSYNQLELYVCSFPGNCYSFNIDYDRFLTLSDAAMCLMAKEHYLHSEESPLQIYYTNRQGVPIAIDITGKEGKVKMTDNSNFFCVGPSGSGKSFHMNSVVRQLSEQGTDIVLVDTGNSYEGLCEHLGGKYISYTREKPIAMNPFKLTKDEINPEKINFLTNLILQLWKGNDSDVSPIEKRVVRQIINEYYATYFDGTKGYTSDRFDQLKKSLKAETTNLNIHDRLNSRNIHTDEVDIEEEIEKFIEDLGKSRKGMKVDELSFNSFYEFACEDIAIICAEDSIPKEGPDSVRPSTFRQQLKPFYKGGEYEKTLNEQSETTLFDENFIVFEIDAVKDDATLFPVIILVIMDVFIQKMRLKKNRKCLVIEEAWKAIATPLMAEYIKYLYKTCRKFWGMVGVVTQELQDIIGSKIVKEAIINNSDVVILLDQSKFQERFDEIQQVLGLTDVDKKKIFTINKLDNKVGRPPFKEVFIRRGLVSGVYGVEVSPEEYMTYTTERIEKEALKLYKRELNCAHEEALRKYISDWRKDGCKTYLAFAQKVMAANKVLDL